MRTHIIVFDSLFFKSISTTHPISSLDQSHPFLKGFFYLYGSMGCVNTTIFFDYRHLVFLFTDLSSRNVHVPISASKNYHQESTILLHITRASRQNVEQSGKSDDVINTSLFWAEFAAYYFMYPSCMLLSPLACV